MIATFDLAAFKVINGKLFGVAQEADEELAAFLERTTKLELFDLLHRAEKEHAEEVTRIRKYAERTLQETCEGHLTEVRGLKATCTKEVKALERKLKELEASIAIREGFSEALKATFEQRVQTAVNRKLIPLRDELQWSLNAYDDLEKSHLTALAELRKLAESRRPLSERLFGSNFHLEISEETAYITGVH